MEFFLLLVKILARKAFWKLLRKFDIMVNLMEYAVLRSGGKQYKVSKGSIIEVDKLPMLKDQETVFDDVLLHVNNGEVRVGAPKVLGVKIKAKVLNQIKGKKIRVAKFKAKVRYRRAMGFRPLKTRLQIEDIESIVN